MLDSVHRSQCVKSIRSSFDNHTTHVFYGQCNLWCSKQCLHSVCKTGLQSHPQVMTMRVTAVQAPAAICARAWDDVRYQRLPSDEHRRMFLDAALLLRGRPAAHLLAVWEGQLLLDADSGVGTPHLLPERRRDADGALEGSASWLQSRTAAATQLAASLLRHLQKEALVSIVDGR